MTAMRRLEPYSQRQVVYELKHAIDRLRRRPWDSQAQVRLDDLLRAHPRALRSRHVTHNLGAARLRALPSRYDARSLGEISQEGGPNG